MMVLGEEKLQNHGLQQGLRPKLPRPMVQDQTKTTFFSCLVQLLSSLIVQSVSFYFFQVSNYLYKRKVDLDRKNSSSSSSSMEGIREATLSQDKATNTPEPMGEAHRREREWPYLQDMLSFVGVWVALGHGWYDGLVDQYQWSVGADDRGDQLVPESKDMASIDMIYKISCEISTNRY